MSNATECSEEQLSIGQRVCVRGNKHGTIKYVGNTYFAKGLWCGVELDEAVGENDGIINSIRYFTCKNNFGLFVPESEIFHKSNTPNMEQSHSSASVSKQLKNSTIYHSHDLEFQINVQNLHTLENHQPVSADITRKSTLNESYTIETARNTLSVIVEENVENVKFSDSSNILNSFYRSTLNKCKNMSNDQKNLNHDNSCAETSINEEIESCCQEKNEYDLADSDESLGILPSAVLEDSHWDNLMSDVEINNVDLNATVNLPDSMDIELNGCEKVMSGYNFDDAFSPIYHISNVSLSCNQNAECPVESNTSFPKYASTPKHETNFSDISNEIENALNLTHNLSSEFQTHTLIENDDENHSTPLSEVYTNVANCRIPAKILDVNIKGLNVTQDLDNIAEDCLNVTFHKELDQNPSALYTNTEIECKISNNFKEDPILDQETKEILNTTYEKELKFSDLSDTKSLQCSKLSMVSENKKSSRYPIKNKDTKSKIHFSNANVSFTKDDTKSKFDRNKFRKSVGYFGSVSAPKSDTINKQARRNSTSSNFSSSKENFPKVKISKFSHSRNLSNKSSIKQSCIKNSVINQENSVAASIAVKKINKNIHKSFIVKSESSNYETKIKALPKVVLQNSQCALNETINLAPQMNDLGKTVVKRPRSSMNFACLNKTSFRDCHTISSGNRSKVAHMKKMIPSKLGRTLEPIEMQHKITDTLNETTLIDTTTKLPSVNDVAFNDKKSKIARLNEKRTSSEKSSSSTMASFGMNHNGLNRSCSVKPYFKPVCTNKVAACRSSSSRKSLTDAPRLDVCNSNDYAVSDRSSCKPANKALKLTNVNKGSSCIPTSKIPSIQRCNLDPQVKASIAIQSSVSQSIGKQDENEKSSHRMILRKRVSTIPKLKSPSLA